MDKLDYNELVNLVRPGHLTKEMTLAEAVDIVMTGPDKLSQLSAVITRDGEPIYYSAEIQAIYARPDFPRIDPK